MTRFLINLFSFLCIVFALLQFGYSFEPTADQGFALTVALASIVSAVIFLSIGRVIDLLARANLYNRILTEKLAGLELAQHVVDTKLMVVGKRDWGRYKEIVEQNNANKFNT